MSFKNPSAKKKVSRKVKEIAGETGIT